MKRKSIIAIALALCICGIFAGCGSSGSSSESTAKSTTGAVKTENTSETVENTEAATNNEATETETENKASSVSYSPSQEIINADVTSGYIQICDDVFRNGGYMTLGDFVAQYGDKWDCSGFDISKPYEREYLFLDVSNKEADNEMKIELCVGSTVSNGGTLGDAVIIKFKPWDGIGSSAWLPTGTVISKGNDTLDSIAALYQSKNFTEGDSKSFSPAIPEKKPTKNVGTFLKQTADDTEKNNSKSEHLNAVVELADENLYGIKPVIQIQYTISDPVDADATMKNIREVAENRNDGDVETETNGIVTKSDERSSSCRYGQIYYKDKTIWKN